jgi:FKBP-type peptidyl-prolyl cis-trans isomerase FklB
MKNFLLAIIALLCFACETKKPETTTSESVKEGVPAFDEAQKAMSVKDLPLQTTDDTISYALGVAWGSQIAGKVGLSKVSYVFYVGAHDYMVQNKTFTTIQKASDRLEKDLDVLKKDSTYIMDAGNTLGSVSLNSKFDTMSYLLGYSWMRGAKEIGINKITPVLLLGLTRGLRSDTTLFDFRKADKYLRAGIERQRESKFFAVKKQNAEWLEQNKSKKDVVVLPSGLQYKIIKNGTGKSPKADEVVVCHYTAKLIDNTKFESSYDQGTPLKAYPSGVIVAWREALPKMKVGSIWELYVPYNLGYGSGGIKNKVPPFATLIYEVELLDVQAGAQ